MAFVTAQNSRGTPINQAAPLVGTTINKLPGPIGLKVKGIFSGIVSAERSRQSSLGSVKSSSSSNTSGPISRQGPDQGRPKSYENAQQDHDLYSLEEFIYLEDDCRANSLTEAASGCTSTKRRPSAIGSIATKIRAMVSTFRCSDRLEPVWTDKYTLDLPAHVSRDSSELDYLRRKNQEAANGLPWEDEGYDRNS